MSVWLVSRYAAASPIRSPTSRRIRTLEDLNVNYSRPSGKRHPSFRRLGRAES